jgi:hypothetical protein
VSAGDYATGMIAPSVAHTSMLEDIASEMNKLRAENAQLQVLLASAKRASEELMEWSIREVRLAKGFPCACAERPDRCRLCLLAAVPR